MLLLLDDFFFLMLLVIKITLTNDFNIYVNIAVGRKTDNTSRFLIMNMPLMPNTYDVSDLVDPIGSNA